MKKKELVDLVFIDPPYEMTHNEINTLLEFTTLSDFGIVVLERPAKEEAPLIEGFFLEQEKSYGDTTVFFLAKDGVR